MAACNLCTWPWWSYFFMILLFCAWWASTSCWPVALGDPLLPELFSVFCENLCSICNSTLLCILDYIMDDLRASPFSFAFSAGEYRSAPSLLILLMLILVGEPVADILLGACLIRLLNSAVLSIISYCPGCGLLGDPGFGVWYYTCRPLKFFVAADLLYSSA